MKQKFLLVTVAAVLLALFSACDSGKRSDDGTDDSSGNDTFQQNDSDVLSENDENNDDDTFGVTNDNETSDLNENKDDESPNVDENDESPDVHESNPDDSDPDEVPDDAPDCMGTELKCEGTVLYSCDNGVWKVEKDCLDDGQLCRNEVCFTPGKNDPRIDFTGPSYGGDTILVLNNSADGETLSFSGTLSAGIVTEPKVKKISNLPFQINDMRPPVPDLGKPLWLTDAGKSRVNPLAFVEGDTDNFYIYNFNSGGRDQVTAELKYSGTEVEIWLISGVTFSDENIQDLAQEFETKIFDLVTTNFYSQPDIDGNGKVSILLGNLGGPGGYISGGDFYTKDQNQYSNFRDLMYIETARGLPQIKNVIAHEFQHLCHANRNLLVEGDWDSGGMYYRWIDEGLAMASMYLHYGPPSVENAVMNSGAYTSIRDGNSFIFWDTTDADKVQSDYAMAYVFFQYLRIQAGDDTSIYRDIIECAANDYTCVEDVIKEKVDPDMDFGEFLTNFRIALLLKDVTGPYGFGGDDDFEFTMQYFTGDSASLRGGGGLYINSDSLFTKPADSGDNIVFAGIMTGDGEMPDDNPISTSIYDIQHTTEAGDGTYPSNYKDQAVTVKGIVTAVNAAGNPKNFYISSSDGGAWNGIYIYNADIAPSVGDEVDVTGTVDEFFGFTEIVNSTVSILSSGNTLPDAAIVPTGDLNSAEKAEAYEGVLVKVEGAEVKTEADEHHQVMVDDGSGQCQIDDDIYAYSFILNSKYDITGVVDYSYSEYGVLPRSNEDISLFSVP